MTFNVGLIGGGATAELDAGRVRINATGKTNIIAGDRHRARRFARDQPRADRPRQGEMQAIVAQTLPGGKAEIVFHPDGYPPMAPTPGNKAILTA